MQVRIVLSTEIVRELLYKLFTNDVTEKWVQPEVNTGHADNQWDK